MPTITALKAAVAAAITNKTQPDSVTRADVANAINANTDEFLTRGVKVVDNTAALSGILGDDSQTVYVKGVGMFTYSASGTVDNVNVFSAMTTGVYIRTLDVIAGADVKNVSKVKTTLYRMPFGNLTNNFNAMTYSGAMASATIGLDDGFDQVIVGAGDLTSYAMFPFLSTINRAVYTLRVRIDAVGSAPIVGLRGINPGGTYSNNAGGNHYYAHFNLLTGAITSTTSGATTQADYNGVLGAMVAGDIVEVQIVHQYMRPQIVSFTKISGMTGEKSIRRQLKNSNADGQWKDIIMPAIILADGTYTILDYTIEALDYEPFILVDGDSMGQSVRVSYADSLDSKLNSKIRYITATCAAVTKRTKGHLATLWIAEKLRPKYLVLFNYLDALFPNDANPASGNHSVWSADFTRYVNTIKALGIKVIFVHPETWAPGILGADATVCAHYTTYLNTNFPSDIKVFVPTANSVYDGTGFHYAGVTNEYIANQIIAAIKTDGGL